jgi:hypothetical protein
MAPVLEPLLLFSQVFCSESKGLVNLEQRQSLLCIYHVFCKKNKAILNSKRFKRILNYEVSLVYGKSPR